MEYDANNKMFILNGADRLALRVPGELANWPIEDAGHLFEEVAFASHWVDDWIDEVYAEESDSWRADEKQKRHETLEHIQEVLAANALDATDLTIPPEA